VGTPDDGQGGFDFTYRVATSRDASISANPTFQVQDIDMGGTCPFLGFVNPAGGLGQPWIATDPQNSDVIYVLASVDPGEGPTDLNFIRSVDGGATWTSPRKITDEPEGPLSFQWFGTLSVAPNGRLDAVWNDTRNDPENPEPMFSELFSSFSEDGGDTWSPNVAVSPAYNHFLGYPRQNKLGDYYHTISDDLGVHVAYAATFNGEQDVYYLRIGSYDCNQNGVADEQDLSEGTSVDGNGDGIPDECAAAAARANLVADFTAAPEGDTEPLEVAFDASLTTTDVAHKVVSYRWDFGDGSTAEGVVANHTYETFGLYDVRLRVEDDLGRRAVTGGGVVVEFRGEDVAPWASDVVGEVEGTVGARFEEECLLFSGPSGALEGRSDKAHFVHQPMAGNFRFTARLTEWAGAEPDSVVGLTVRASREDNARHGTVALRRLEDAFQHRFVRRQTLFTRFVDNKVYESLGLWLRIDRRGGMVSGQLSVDGETWTEPDSVELEGLPEEVHVGLVLASSEDVPSAATFCDLSFEELPDEVGLQILRGDCDDNGDVDISDGRCILDWRFSGSPAPGCLAATNINGDGQTNIADAIYLFSSLFLGGPPPVPPFPGCGALTEDDAAFGCETPPAGCAL
jgi:regulation of enolase protein 1 (concanavalin A-like superfamily)